MASTTSLEGLPTRIICCHGVERREQPASSNGRTTLVQLPRELIYRIVSHLEPAYLLTLGQACHFFRSLPSLECRPDFDIWNRAEKFRFMTALLSLNDTSRRICIPCVKILPAADFDLRSSPTSCLRHASIWFTGTQAIPPSRLRQILAAGKTHGTLSREHVYKHESLEVHNQFQLHVNDQQDGASVSELRLETVITLRPDLPRKFDQSRQDAFWMKSALRRLLPSKDKVAALLASADMPMCVHMKISDPRVLELYDSSALISGGIDRERFSRCEECRKAGAVTKFGFRFGHVSGEGTEERVLMRQSFVLIRGLEVPSRGQSVRDVIRSVNWKCHAIPDHCCTRFREAWRNWVSETKRLYRDEGENEIEKS